MTRQIYSWLLVLVLSLAPIASAHETDKPHEESAGNTPAASDAKSRIRAKHKEDLAAARAARDAYKESKRTESVAKQLAAIKEYGVKMFDVRQKVLASHPDRQKGEHCSTADKADIANSIAASQAILTTAKTELAAATKVDDAKQTIKSAVEQTRIFAVWAPAVNGLCRASRLIALIDGRLTKAVNVLKVAGRDVGPLTEHLAQARAKVVEAHDIYKGLVLAPNFPDTTPAKEKFAQAKNALNAAKGHLNEFKTLLKELKKALEGSGSGTSHEKTEVTP